MTFHLFTDFIVYVYSKINELFLDAMVPLEKGTKTMT